jgi:hypothetical protein
MTDIAEVAGYFIFFWAFIFSPGFRQDRISEWTTGGWISRFFILLEALSSFLCGVAVPILLIWWVIFK